MDGFWADRSVAVTGATGLVGSWLTRSLIDSGAVVTALIRDLDPMSELVRSGAVSQIKVVQGDLERFDDVSRLVAEADCSVIFHLGAQTIVGTAGRSPRATLETNVRGTWNVLDAARLAGSLVQAVIVASSDKAYGTQELPYREDDRLEGSGPYEVSKSCTDLICTSYANAYDVPVSIARCGNIFGGGDLNWTRLVPGTVRSLLLDQRPILRSDGTFLHDYIHVDDVVCAYLLLAERTAGGGLNGEAFNFSNERPLNVREMYDAVCRAALKPSVEPVVLGEAASEIRDQYLDASKAREQLNWQARLTLEDGLSGTVDWYRQHFERTS